MTSKMNGGKQQNNKPKPDPSTPYSCTELAEALRSIQLAVCCYSCNKSLRSARTCLNGHGVCSKCMYRCNRRCPKCNALIMDSKPSMLNDVLKLLPRQCNFNDKGCDSLILASDHHHEKFCCFRLTTCRFRSCTWKGMAKDLLLHLEKSHGKEILRTPLRTIIMMDFNTRMDKEGLAAIIAFNNIFWQHTRIRENHLLQFYQYVPMATPTTEYNVKVTFHTPEASYSKVTPVHSDTFDYHCLYNDKDTFHLPKKVATSFNQFHSGVYYTYEITQNNI